MRNNAAYLPENPIVYIIFPESIHNRASFTIFALPYGNNINIIENKNESLRNHRQGGDRGQQRLALAPQDQTQIQSQSENQAFLV
ncbi:hypothetical protein CE91St16_26570 [Alistipes finegoldii]|uniref:Uncharacterized protein n=1 Tax=Alistipes finegoldii TaxID=214856 RepID=A0AA37NP83_9BACT|nr:hypothetical protein CE91St15_08890 [Alistipes finegoldii]GKI19749.1 hypothetical protein CE91St16_26570 [Alistipes finegoldii]